MYFKAAMGVVLVYSVDNRLSFHSIGLWHKQVENYATPGVPILLVGNKSDLGESGRIVQETEGSKLAELMSIPFYEVSVKLDLNVRKAIMELVKRVAARTEPLLRLHMGTDRPKPTCRC
jgi:small GTP-binding protein